MRIGLKHRFVGLMLIPLVSLLVAGCGSSTDESFIGGEDSMPLANTVPANPNPPDPIVQVAPSSSSVPSPQVQDSSSSSSSNFSPVVIRRFIWKPQSERDGNLVMLVDPTNVRIEVTGAISATGTNTGSSNGYGTTSRVFKSGCSFGNNVRVTFFDSRGRQMRVADGRTAVTVPSGCSRLEF